MRKKIKAPIRNFTFSNLMNLRYSNQKLFWWIILGSILLLSVLGKWLYTTINRSGMLPEMPIQAQTIQVKQASMPDIIETVGTMTAKTKLTIKAVAPGRVHHLLVDSGSYVKKGTLLANIVGAPEIQAPFDGYLTDWRVDSGEFVSPGTELVDLVNTDLLALTYRVPEQVAGKLDIGQVVEVKVKAFPDQIFQGTVYFIAPVVDHKTYTILIRAKVKNPDQNLWPGMSAHVRHILVTFPEALVIPEACLKLTMEGYVVFVIEDGVIQKKTIQIGSRQNGRVHILSGLKLGNTVILTRNSFIEEGKKAVANEWVGDW